MTTTLHYFPGNASMAPHMLLREIGAPFELALVDRAANAQNSPAYLRLNPNGTIPVLVNGDLVLHEAAAILLHLCDAHPQADLAPALGTAERAQFYKWLFWLSNTLQASMKMYFYAERYVDAGNTAGAAEVKRHAEAAINTMIDQLEAQLAGHGGPFFLGARFSALDPYVLMLCRWTRGFARPARSLAALAPYLQRVLARPAVQSAFKTEGLQAPWV